MTEDGSRMRALAATPQSFPSDGLALVHGDVRWSWAQLRKRAAQWRGWLVERGVQKNDLVAFGLANGPDFFALTFGIYGAGATPAPLSSKLPPFELEAILDVMRPSVFVRPGEGPATDAAGDLDDANQVALSWKACTSGGSTGRPKIIVDGRPATFPPETEFIGIPANSCVLVPGPLYHNAPFSAAVFALWRGSTVVTMDRFDADVALALIAREHATWSIMVPTMLGRILALPREVRDAYDLTVWRMVVHTAAPMPAWLKLAWIEWRGADHIWEVYGATEGLARCWIGGREWLERVGSVGRPIGGARLRILDPYGFECPPNVEGEVFAMPHGGPGSTYRYIGAERRVTPDGWESVGDMGRIDSEGYLYLADRRTDLIIQGGVNIWPAEVEAAILRHPDVRSCAVYGTPDKDLGQRVHAVIETDNDLLDAETLGAFLSDYLVRPKHPRSVTRQEDAVRDDAGKFRKSPPAAMT